MCFVQALVISYTSDFIPRLVYMWGYSDDNSLEGYMNNSLAGTIAGHNSLAGIVVANNSLAGTVVAHNSLAGTVVAHKHLHISL